MGQRECEGGTEAAVSAVSGRKKRVSITVDPFFCATHQLIDILIEVHIAQLSDAQEGRRSELRREGNTGSIPECTSSRKEQLCRCSVPLVELCLATPEPPKHSTADCCSGRTHEEVRPSTQQARRQQPPAGFGQLLQPVGWQSRLSRGWCQQRLIRPGSPRSQRESPRASSQQAGTPAQQSCSQQTVWSSTFHPFLDVGRDRPRPEHATFTVTPRPARATPWLMCLASDESWPRASLALPPAPQQQVPAREMSTSLGSSHSEQPGLEQGLGHCQPVHTEDTGHAAPTQPQGHQGDADLAPVQCWEGAFASPSRGAGSPFAGDNSVLLLAV